jgi:lipid-A-disaccharide synthase-like uncharacterized protein
VSLDWIGFVGTGLVIAAYVPQLAHLVRARCASGVSLGAYLAWSLSAAFLLTYALSTADRVFIALQAYQLLALTTIYILARHHRGRGCELHCGSVPDTSRRTAAGQVREDREAGAVS